MLTAMTSASWSISSCGSVRLCTVLLVLLIMSGCTAQSNDDNMPLNRWPMIESHDAGTGYLRPEDVEQDIVFAWTKTQAHNFTMQLDCGSRAFDWRPFLRPDNTLVFHHGVVVVPHLMSQALDEVVTWASSHRDGANDLVYMQVWDCSGAAGCDETAEDVIKAAGVAIVSCDQLWNMTLAEAVNAGALSGGGAVLATINCNSGPPGWVTYDGTRSCNGFVDSAEGQSWQSEVQECFAQGKDPSRLEQCLGALVGLLNSSAHYSCYPSGHNASYAWGRFLEFDTNLTSLQPPALPKAALYSIGGNWDQTDASTAIGFLYGSSLLQDEEKSKLNSQIAQWIMQKDASGEFLWRNVPSMIGLNNVCDNGPEVLKALRSRLGS